MANAKRSQTFYIFILSSCLFHQWMPLSAISIDFICSRVRNNFDGISLLLNGYKLHYCIPFATPFVHQFNRAILDYRAISSNQSLANDFAKKISEAAEKIEYINSILTNPADLKQQPPQVPQPVSAAQPPMPAAQPPVYAAAKPVSGGFSITAWQSACSSLPIYNPSGINSAFLIRAQDFVELFNRFLNCMQKELASNVFISLISPQTRADLLKKGKAPVEPAPTDLFDIQNKKLLPFVQKKIVHVDAQGNAVLFCLSDIHGDIHSLIAFLNELLGKKDLDDSGTLSKSSHYLIFQGDYVDGGWYGLEVLYVLMALKVNNPDNVIIIRGNHEEIAMNTKQNASYYTFARELNDKDAAKLLGDVAYLYKLMPVAAYLGVKNQKGNQYDYSLHSHAYVEIGFNPLYLMREQAAQFSFIPQTLDRKSALEKLWDPQSPLLDKQLGSSFLTDSSWSDKDHYENSLQFLNFTYGDLELSEPYVASGKKRTHIQAFGQKITEAILKSISDNQHIVQMMVRGHQHSPLKYSTNSESDVLINLKKNNGIAKYWEAGQAKTTGGLWRGMVVSLWSSPLNMFGKTQWNISSDPAILGKTPPSWDSQSVAILVMSNKGFGSWQLGHINIHKNKILPGVQQPWYQQFVQYGQQ